MWGAALHAHPPINHARSNHIVEHMSSEKPFVPDLCRCQTQCLVEQAEIRLLSWKHTHAIEMSTSKALSSALLKACKMAFFSCLDLEFEIISGVLSPLPYATTL